MTERPIEQDGSTERDVRPLVARSRGSTPTWLLVVGALLAAILLFVMLDARRRDDQVAVVQPRVQDIADLPTALPSLDIPPEQPAPEPVRAAAGPIYPSSNIPMGSPFGSAPVILRSSPPPVVYAPPPATTQTIGGTGLSNGGGSAVVIDTSAAGASGVGQSPGSSSAPPGASGAASTPVRVQAGKLAGRSTTVTQGTLIHAVLETGFDSTRPGFARAVVSRDIRGFDGSRVLIPRGSRVVGEYQADVRPGQKRALIIWNRLIRPDGATIEMGSPASDPVGRGGVKAEVNSHFFERFSGAILQSALDIGVNLASRSADRSVYVALPNSSALTSPIIPPTTVTPTLKVKPATSISIFVARDLDFTEVENGQ